MLLFFRFFVYKNHNVGVEAAIYLKSRPVLAFIKYTVNLWAIFVSISSENMSQNMYLKPSWLYAGIIFTFLLIKIIT